MYPGITYSRGQFPSATPDHTCLYKWVFYIKSLQMGLFILSKYFKDVCYKFKNFRYFRSISNQGNEKNNSIFFSDFLF